MVSCRSMSVSCPEAEFVYADIEPLGTESPSSTQYMISFCKSRVNQEGLGDDPLFVVIVVREYPFVGD